MESQLFPLTSCLTILILQVVEIQSETLLPVNLFSSLYHLSKGDKPNILQPELP